MEEEEKKTLKKRLAFCLPVWKNTTRSQTNWSKSQSQPRQVNLLKKLLYSMSLPATTYSIDKDSSIVSEFAIDLIQHPKPMLVAETKEDEKISMKNSHRESKGEVVPNSTDIMASTSSTQRKFDQNLGNVDTKHPPMCVINLVGTNKGASMVADNGCHHDHRANCTKESKKNERNPCRDRNIVNSNTLSINNSILQTSSCRERSPGVYVNIHTRGGECVNPIIKNSTKPNPKILSTQKLCLQEPTSVRGRCLRGHLSESDESCND